jgi:glycosyltransferase involved in cell wall biosynthesis
MNIGLDIRNLSDPVRTGVGEYTAELITNILDQDKQNNYFLFYNSLKDLKGELLKYKAENVYYIKTSWPNKLLNASLLFLKKPKLDRLISKNIGTRMDLDVFYSPNLNFTALSADLPFVLTIHDLSFVFLRHFYSTKRQLWHFLINARKQCQRADLILAPSENTKNDIIKLFEIPDFKIKVISPGLSTTFLKQDTASAQKIKIKYGLPEKFIFFLGTIEPRKNIDGLVDAFLYWQKKNSYAEEYKLVIAGAKGWCCTKILERIEENKKIKYVGYVRPEEKRVFYELADVFVYPAFYEGFGFPVLEAMSVGTPVITSARSSLPEVTANASYLVNPHNISEIAKGLQLLTSDHYLRNELIDRGYKQLDKFSWKKAASEWYEAVKETTGKICE